MENAALQKYFSGIEGLQANGFFKKTDIVKDIHSGEVFAAIRKEEVHFYYGGARLCVYEKGSLPAVGKMFTNNRYLDMPDTGRSRDIPIPEDWFSPTKYQKLKSNCRERRPVESELELELVSRLFPEFSFCASTLPAGRARLLDIEVRFPGKPGEKQQDMVDCLFITPSGVLVFVEVKRSSSKEARSDGTREPAIVEQLQRYKRQLGSDEAMIAHIKQVYADVSTTLRTISGQTSQPQAITDVFRSVPLLIVGEASPPSKASRETWQRDLLAEPFRLDSPIIAIDGRGSQSVEALHNLFRAIDQRA